MWFQKEPFGCGVKSNLRVRKGEEGWEEGESQTKWKEGEHYKQTKMIFVSRPEVEEREDAAFKRYGGCGVSRTWCVIRGDCERSEGSCLSCEILLCTVGSLVHWDLKYQSSSRNSGRKMNFLLVIVSLRCPWVVRAVGSCIDGFDALRTNLGAQTLELEGGKRYQMGWTCEKRI